MTAYLHLVAKALRAGKADLDRHAALIDRINVFPVMDGDTGINLRATLEAMPSVAADSDDVPQTSAWSLRLLENACGNSGIILAEFLVGFLERVAAPGSSPASDFVAGVARGRARAYRAVSQPKEGTMLTLMTLLDAAMPSRTETFTMADHRSLEATLLKGVLDTPRQLPLLANAGVVDAGALGFYLIASGLALCLAAADDEARALREMDRRIAGTSGAPITDVADRVLSDYASDARIKGAGRRFCMNVFVETEDHRSVGALLDTLGDSLNTARFGTMLKVHIHTDDPARVDAALLRIGTVKETVLQDMRKSLLASALEDHASRRADWIPVRVVGDSAISLDRALADSLGILRLDNHINIAGKRVADRDVDTAKLLAEMKAGALFSTAQVTPDAAARFLDDALAVSGSVIFIAVGHAYTGTQRTVVKEAARHKEKARIRVLDSVAASGQQGLVCLVTQQFASRGHGLDETVSYAKAQIASCKEYLFIPELKYLKRTGRIGSVKAAFASALSIKPIVGHGPQGAVTHAKASSRDKAVETILSRVAAHPGDGPLAVMVEYTDNRGFAESLQDRMLSVLPKGATVVLSPLSSASAVHMGPGAFGVAVTRR